MAMPGRTFSSPSGAGGSYSYGFNGKEKDKDISEGGQDYGMRISDNRLGRFLSSDPITSEYPELTPYQFASNRPIDGIDEDGLEHTPSSKQFSRDNTSVMTLKINPDQNLKFLNDLENKRWQNINDPYILAHDFNGNVVNQKSSYIRDLNAVQKREYFDAWGENIKGGLGGSIGSLINGYEGSRIGAGVDGVATAVSGFPVENSSVLSRAKANPNTSTNVQATTAHNGNPKTAATAHKVTVTQKQLQFEKNKLAGKLSEAIVENRLKASLSNTEGILKRPRVYLYDDNGNLTKDYAVPDFVTYCKTTGIINAFPDAKNGGAGFSPPQKQLNKNGGVFKGSSRDGEIKKNQVIAPGMMRKEPTNVFPVVGAIWSQK